MSRQIEKDKIRFEKIEAGDYECVLSREKFSGNGYCIYGINVRLPIEVLVRIR